MTRPNIKGVTSFIPNHKIVKRTIIDIDASAKQAGITDSVYREIFDSLSRPSAHLPCFRRKGYHPN